MKKETTEIEKLLNISKESEQINQENETPITRELLEKMVAEKLQKSKEEQE